MRHIIRKFFPGFFVFFLLAGCSFLQPVDKSIPSPTVAASETMMPTETVTTLPPTPTNTPMVLPPTLVDVQPAPASILSLQEPLTFYFNQAMDKESVEGSFEIKPSIPGSLIWLEDSVLQFKPEGDYPTSTSFLISFREGVLSANGLAMLRSVEFSFQSSDYLRVSAQLPEPGDEKVGIDSSIMVTFNQSVVGDGQPAFSIQPEMDGTGKWVTDSIYAFYPQDSGLLASTQYTIQLNTQLVGLSGASLAPNYLDQDSSWSFSTDSPRLLSVQPEDGSSLPALPEFVLNFNQPMDTESVQMNLSLQNARGKELAGEFTWEKDNTQLHFQPLNQLDPEAEYSLVLLGLASSQGGTPIKDNFAAGYVTYPQLTLQDDFPEMVQLTYDGGGSFVIHFNSPLAEGQNLAGLIDFSPVAMDVRAMLDDTDPASVVVEGVFKPGNNYFLGISSELLDAYDRKLGRDLIKSFKTSSLPPALVFPLQEAGFATIDPAVEGMPPIFLPLEDPLLPAVTANVRSLNVSSSHLTVEEFIQMTGATNQERLNFPLQDVTTWRQSVPQFVNYKTLQVEIPFAPARKTPSTGFYSLLITSDDLPGETGYIPTPVLAVISQVQIFVEMDTHTVVAWVINMATGEPVQAAPVIVYNSQAEILGGSSTDDFGRAIVEIPDGNGLDDSVFVVAWKPGHPDFGMTYTGWSLKGFGWEQYRSVVTPDEQFVGKLYTDRLLYNPGETVNFRAVLRMRKNGVYQPTTELGNITVNVLGEPVAGETEWRILGSIPLDLSAFGTATGTYQIPRNLAGGTYKFQIQEAFDPVRTNSQVETVFYIQSDDIRSQIDASFIKDDWLNSEVVKAEVRIHTSSGIPQVEYPVHLTLLATPFEPVDTDGDVTGKQEISLSPDQNIDPAAFDQTKIVDQTGMTGTDGIFRFEITVEDLQQILDIEKEYKLTLVVESDLNPGTKIYATADLHPAEYAIRIHPESWGKQVGEELGFTIQTLDWQGNPSGSHPISAQFRKVLWNSSDKLDETTGFPVYGASYIQVGSTDFSTDANGMARLVFSPSEPGVYQLRIVGDGAVSELYTWVGGNGSANWATFPNQTILLASDKRQYVAGETAQIFIPNPFYGLTYAMILVERDHILYTDIVAFEGSSYEYALNISKDFSPGSYVVVLLFGKQNNDEPDFRQGILELPVLDKENALELSLNTQVERILPGDEVTLMLQVRDYQGRPVRGEFSLAVLENLTDKNPFAGNQSLLNGFYSIQDLGVFRNNSLAAYMRGGLLSVGGRKLTGTSFDGGSSEPVAGQDSILATSPETVYWSGSVETDENGMAEIQVNLPDRAANWLVDVLGCTLEGKFGETQLQLDAYDDLELALSAPDMLDVGDHVRIEGYIQNKTGQDIDLSVSLDGNSFIFDQTDQQVQSITVVKGKEAKVIWWGTITGEGRVELQMTAQSMDQQLNNSIRKIISIQSSLITTGYSFSGFLQEEEVQDVFGIPQNVSELKGNLMLVISPSLPSLMVELVQQLENQPSDQVEMMASKIIAYIELQKAFTTHNIQVEGLEDKITRQITELAKKLRAAQNQDGGWGWYAGANTDDALTAYVYYGLSRMDQEMGGIDTLVLQKAEAYLIHSVSSIGEINQSWQLDRLALQYFALSVGNKSIDGAETLLDNRGEMSSLAKALLALTLENLQPGNPSSRDLVTELLSTAQSSSDGLFWQTSVPIGSNNSSLQWLYSSRLNTAIVLAAISQTDPADVDYSAILRYLFTHRSWNSAQAGQWAWLNSYEMGWIVSAVAGVLDTTYGNQALAESEIKYSASLNGITFIDEARDGQSTGSTVVLIPLEQVDRNFNLYQLVRTIGQSGIFYHAEIQVTPDVLQLEAENRGISISRVYTLAGLACGFNTCSPLDSLEIGSGTSSYLVQLNLVVENDVSHVFVVDHVSSGTEIISDGAQDESGDNQYDPANPYGNGWGSWLFSQPQIKDGTIMWYAEYLPAGSYTMIYQVHPLSAGEYKLLPARADVYYVPFAGGNTESEVISVLP